MKKYLCLHGHFYQPPRENAWLEAIEFQESAWPYHDWNERITDECYGPNAHARILDQAGKIQRIVNNYSLISFNFGPTLLTWMQHESPEVYRSILEADRLSIERFGGHGSAMAQAYNHMIMPLANPRDIQTQVHWGARDFEYRFGRRAEGMWLPETAVDLATLEALAAEGIRFTVLEPHQAARYRRQGEKKWTETSAAPLDPRQPYRCALPSGAEIALFFYDGPISRGIAFEHLLDSGEAFINRLNGAFDPHRDAPQLVHVATDGETYGHHHRFGEMALAYALKLVEARDDITLINYGQYLELHPPQHDVEIHERTAWSCAHGVGRWERDCGCNVGSGAGWNQRWRAPLREGFNQLRDAIAPVYEQAVAGLLKDPWAARDGYIEVALGRTPARLARFFGQWSTRELEPAEQTRVLKALEMQRHAMLMFTSCGWFFDDLGGIETVQVMQYAARAGQLAGELDGGRDFIGPLLATLEQAVSNRPELGNGRQIWERYIPCASVDLAKVGAQYGVSSLFKDYAAVVNTYCYTLHRLDYRLEEAGRSRLAIGRVRVHSDVTLEEAVFCFAVLSFGDHNLTGGVCPDGDDAHYRQMQAPLLEAFSRADLPGVIRSLDHQFKASLYSLRSLFKDEQRWILERILAPQIEQIEQTYERLHQENFPLIRFLETLSTPVPRAIAAVAEFAIGTTLRNEIRSDDPDPDRIGALMNQAREEKIHLDAASLEYPLRRQLEQLIRRFSFEPDNPALLHQCLRFARILPGLPFSIDMAQIQNRYYSIMQNTYPVYLKRAEDAQDNDARQWLDTFGEIGRLLNVRVDAESIEMFADRS